MSFIPCTVTQLHIANITKCTSAIINLTQYLLLVTSLKGLWKTVAAIRTLRYSIGQRVWYVVGSKSFRPDIQKPRQMENAVRDI